MNKCPICNNPVRPENLIAHPQEGKMCEVCYYETPIAEEQTEPELSELSDITDEAGNYIGVFVEVEMPSGGRMKESFYGDGHYEKGMAWLASFGIVFSKKA